MVVSPPRPRERERVLTEEDQKQLDDLGKKYSSAEEKYRKSGTEADLLTFKTASQEFNEAYKRLTMPETGLTKPETGGRRRKSKKSKKQTKKRRKSYRKRR